MQQKKGSCEKGVRDMDMTNLNKAKILVALVEQANEQIEVLETMKNSNEIAIIINSPKFQEVVKGVAWGSKDRSPNYYTSKQKEEVINVLLEARIKWRDKKLEEFEKL